MVIKKIKKYIKIYLLLVKYSLIEITTYRVSFLVELAVELGYQGVSILFLNIVYSNVQEIAGWNFYDIIFLAGIDIITGEILLGALSIFNLRTLPEKISSGSFDNILLKPLNCLFQASLGHPYVMSFISTISGVYLIYYALANSTLTLNISNLSIILFLLICGFMIGYAILVITASLSFRFINTSTFPTIGERILFYKSNPHNIYHGTLKLIFFYIFPVVFISSIPASAVIDGINIKYILSSFCTAVIFLFLAIKFWNKMTKYYSSASS